MGKLHVVSYTWCILLEIIDKGCMRDKLIARYITSIVITVNRKFSMGIYLAIFAVFPKSCIVIYDVMLLLQNVLQ